MAATAPAVPLPRMRTVLIRPHGKGLIATTLNYDYAVQSSKKIEEMPKIKLKAFRMVREDGLINSVMVAAETVPYLHYISTLASRTNLRRTPTLTEGLVQHTRKASVLCFLDRQSILCPRNQS